jgi:Carboxypeptidase regulatory-like domain
MRSRIVRAVCAALLAMPLSTPALAQVSTATILGVVQDTSGGVLPGVTVIARHVDTGRERETISGGDGSYRLSAMQVGRYEIRAALQGFKTEIRTGITLGVTQEAVVNFSLEVGALEESVTVTGEAPLISTTSASLGALVDETQLAQLPLNGRNYVDLSLMQAGVSQNKGASGGMTGVWFTANGAPMRSNNFTIDGAPMNSLIGGAAVSAAGTTLGLDGIREYKVVTNSFSAEYGQTMGSQVVLVSKSGSNDWHGSIFEYVRDSALDSKNFFDAGSKPPFRRNNFGASFGGPIKKDKTFFFGVYEGLRQNLGYTARNTVPPGACHTANNIVDGSCVPGLAPGDTLTVAPVIRPLLALLPSPNLPNNQHTFDTGSDATVDYGQFRIDHTFSGSDSFFVRYTIDDGNVDNANNGIIPASSGTAIPGVRFEGRTRNQFLTLSENHVFSPTVLNSVRASYSGVRLQSGVRYDTNLIGPQYSMIEGLPIGSFGITGFTTFGGPSTVGPPDLRQIQGTYSFGNDLTVTRGEHALKFGGLINRIQDQLTLPFNTSGAVSFATLRDFVNGIPRTFQAETPGSNPNHDYSYSTVGLYAHDDWRATSRLSVTMGLRYEFMTTPTDSLGNDYAFRNIRTDAVTQRGMLKNYTLKNFAPRAGFAYDLTGSGKTVIRGAYGIFQDVGNIGQVFFQNAYGTPPNASTSSVTNTANAVMTLPLTFPSGTQGARVLTNQYDAQQPYTAQFNVTLGQELPGNMGLTVAYVGLRGYRIWNTVEGNPVQPTSTVDGRMFWGPSLVSCANVVPSCRTNPNLGSVFYVGTFGHIWYDGLQVNLNKRVSGGLQAQAAYTWSRTLDTYQANGGNNDGGGTRLNPFNEEYDKGPAFTDVPQSLRLSVVYEFPRADVAPALSAVLNGWRMAHIISMQDGYPFTPTVATNRSRSGNLQSQTDRVDLGHDTVAPGQTDANGNVNNTSATFVPYDPKKVITGSPDQWFNPYMFRLSPLGYQGNSGRNVLRGPGLFTWDMSLSRDIALPRFGKAEFRVEIFNVPNRTNFGSPSSNVFVGSLTNASPFELATGTSSSNPLGTAGRITTTATPSRQVQVSLRMSF